MSDATRSAPDAIDVSILMPVLNEEAFIERALASALAQRFPRRIEVLVIDGRSTDSTVSKVLEIAARDPRVRLLENPERRIPNGLNIGLGMARGEYIARMDGHCFFPPDYVARGVERLETGDADWAMGAPVPDPDGKWSRRIALALGTPLGAGGLFKRQAQEGPVGTSVSNGVLRRRDVLSYGGWDEGWPVNEDVVLAARMLRDNRRIVSVPEMAARYVPRDSLAALARQYWRYGRYRVKTTRKYPECLRGSHLLPPALPIAVAIAATPSRRPAVIAATPPRRRGVARVALAWYAATVISAITRAGVRERASLADAPGAALALTTMHLAWGTGFLVGCVRSGPPLAALARLLAKLTRPLLGHRHGR